MKDFFRKLQKNSSGQSFSRPKQPFPPIGQRIIKTSVAVFLCLIIHILRGYQGILAQSCIASIICMQPYTSDSLSTAANRVAGTVLGGLWALLFLALLDPFPMLAYHMWLVYFLMAASIILVLYSCVVLRLNASAALTAIVYLCIIINYPAVEAPLQLTLSQIVDTIIGVLVALLINSIHLPRKKQTDLIFFLHLQDLVADRYSQVSSRVLIELNRLYDEDARICLVSKWAPAFLISQMGLLQKINLPIIVMDGAALYDIRENVYCHVMDIDHKDANLLLDYLAEQQLCCQLVAIRENSMLFYRFGQITPREEADYQMMKRSPYRNYVEGSYHENDRIVQIRFIIDKGRESFWLEQLQKEPEIRDRFRIVCRSMPRMPEASAVFFYRKDVSVHEMEKYLLTQLEQEGEVRPVYLRPTSSHYNPERDAPILLSRLKHMYELPRLTWKRRNEGRKKP